MKYALHMYKYFVWGLLDTPPSPLCPPMQLCMPHCHTWRMRVDLNCLRNVSRCVFFYFSLSLSHVSMLFPLQCTSSEWQSLLLACLTFSFAILLSICIAPYARPLRPSPILHVHCQLPVSVDSMDYIERKLRTKTLDILPSSEFAHYIV